MMSMRQAHNQLYPGQPFAYDDPESPREEARQEADKITKLITDDNTLAQDHPDKLSNEAKEELLEKFNQAKAKYQANK